MRLQTGGMKDKVSGGRRSEVTSMRSSTTPDFPESGVQEPFSKKVCREFIVGDLIDETDWYDVTTQESSVTFEFDC